VPYAQRGLSPVGNQTFAFCLSAGQRTLFVLTSPSRGLRNKGHRLDEKATSLRTEESFELVCNAGSYFAGGVGCGVEALSVPRGKRNAYCCCGGTVCCSPAGHWIPDGTSTCVATSIRMPAAHTTRLSASAQITTTIPTASTTSRAARNGRPIQLQQSSSPSPSQAQDQARANFSHGGHSPHRYSSSAAQSPVSPDIGGRTIAEETSPATDSLSPWRSSSTKQNIPPSADADSGETYSTGSISPTHEMAQSQRRMSEHEAAVMAGNRSIGAPTPTSTSSYGGAKDEGGYGVMRESEFGGTDDGYGGGMVGAVGLGELGMHGGSASPSYEMDAGDHDGGQEPTGDAGEQDGIDDSDAVRGLFKMRSEGEGQDQEQSGIWTEMKTKVSSSGPADGALEPVKPLVLQSGTESHLNRSSKLTFRQAGKERKRLPLACIMCRRKKWDHPSLRASAAGGFFLFFY